MRIRFLVLALLAGCGFDPTAPSGGVLCSEAESCPGGLTCCPDNVCRDECGAGKDMGPADVPPADTTPCVSDDDRDGVCDTIDNCPALANPSQVDCDGNSIGDACDPVYTPGCVTLRATLSSAGGVAEGASDRVVGVLAEPAQTTSSSPTHRLRGGLFPRVP